ncbi:MAG: FAD-dependent oxidoreductase [Terriglobales bacterium]
MYDLIVIGGGPGGTATAILCARHGARVLLLERGRFPRHKVCGEFVSAESLGLLAELLDQQDGDLLRAATRIPQARMFLDGRVLQTPIEPAAASIARLDLDAALWKSAERAGVEARQQVTVQRVVGTGPFVVSSSLGEQAGRAVVNATGRWSNLNAGSRRNGKAATKWIGLKAHFAEVASPASVDLYFFDGGYCGIQPVTLGGGADQQRVNACAMVRADVASTMPEMLALHPALQERADRWRPLSDPVSVGPLLFQEPCPEADGMLRVGDATAFVDPFVGDGISLALRSGALAAQCLTPFFGGTGNVREAARCYAESYKRQLGTVFQTSARIRRMLLLPRAVRVPILFLLENAPAVTRHLVTRTR